MQLSRIESSTMLKMLKKDTPALWFDCMKEINRAKSDVELIDVWRINQSFKKLMFDDKRLLLAVLFKHFHPNLYEKDNMNLQLKRGLCYEVDKITGMKRSNCSFLMKEVRVRLIHNYEDLRERTDEAYNKIKENL